MCRVTVAGLILFMGVLAAPPAPGQTPKPRTDASGDPLPPGALLRLGTVRWRAETAWGGASALGPDGKTVYVANDRGNIRVVDLDSGLTQRTLRGHEGDIRALAISRDGKLLASAGYKETFLWDVESGKRLRPFKATAVAVLAFTPNGKKLITGGEDHERSVRVLDVATGKEELRMLWHQRRVGFVGCGPDNKTLVTASWDNDIRVTDLTTGDALHTIRDKDAHDPVVALSPDGKTIAVAHMRYQQKQPHWFHTLRLIDVATGKPRQLVERGKESISFLVFTPDGRSLLAWGEKLAEVYDVATGKPVRQLPGVHGRYFTPDGRHVVSAGSVIRVWDFESGKELHPPEGPVSQVDSLSFSPDGATIASSSFDDRNVIHLWDAATGKLKGTLRGHDGYIRGVEFAPNGRLISGAGDSTLRVWDVAAGKEVFQFKLHEPRAGEKPLQVVTMRVATDGRTLAAAAVGFEGGPGKETVRLFAWNLANGKTLAASEHAGYFSDWPGFTTDSLAFVAREGKDLVLKDLVTGKERLKFQPAPQPTGEGVLNPNILEHPFSFSPDGRVMVAAGSRQRNEGTRYWRDWYALVLFDVATGSEMRRIPVDGWRRHAAFSPDGKRLAGADGPGVRIWETATGKRLWESPELDTRVTALAFSPDGRRLATGLGNTTVLIWDVGSVK
jgi:WD40 repeat protein